MAQHLLAPTLRPEPARAAAYYSRDLARPPDDDYSATVAHPREDLDPVVAELLGLSPARAPTPREVAALLAGRRTDGRRIAGKQVQRAVRSLADELGLNPARFAAPGEVDRVLAGRRADTGEALEARDRITLQKRFLRLYGANYGGLSEETLANIRAGRRGDASALDADAYAAALTASRRPVAYADLTFAAPKDLSVASALAPSEAERALLVAAHRGAVDDVLHEIERVLGRARKGKGGRAGADQGAIAWVVFTHMTARPSPAQRRLDAVEADAVAERKPIAGDCHVHSHVIVLNIVVVMDARGEPARIGGLDLQRLEGRVHAFGALYHACLARRLRQVGVAVGLDARTGAARLLAVPAELCELFAKRTARGTQAARDYAARQGLDWERLDNSYKIKLMKAGTQDPRGPKRDDLADFELWRRQAKAAGWDSVRVLEWNAIGPPLDWTVRAETARRTALRLLDPQLRENGGVDQDELRLVATRALIAAGLEAVTEVDDLVGLLVSGGVTQNGLPTRLLPERLSGGHGRKTVRYITSAALEREDRLAALALAAADCTPAPAREAPPARGEQGSDLGNLAELGRGQAEGSLRLLRDAGHARLVVGSYPLVVDAIANLWRERLWAHRAHPEYTLLVVAATAPDTRAIGEALRARRRAEIGPDEYCIDAVDSLGAPYKLRLAAGDQIRVFARVNARDGRGLLGHAGSVLRIEKIEADGLILRNRKGRTGLVEWSKLRDRESGRIRLAYAEVVTIAEGATAVATEAIFALPSGSSVCDATGAAVALSRGQQANFLVVSEAAERREIAMQRSPGEALEVDAETIWTHVARNLGRVRTSQPLETFRRSREVLKAAGDDFRLGVAALQARAEPGGKPMSVVARPRNSAMTQAVATLKAALALRREAAAKPARFAGVVKPTAVPPFTDSAPEDAGPPFLA